MAAAAVHHGRSRAFSPGTPLEDVLREAETFATGDYATFLVRGAAMAETERAEILGRLADLLGLPLDRVVRADGRITINVFTRELLRDERRVLGLYDTTITATDPFPIASRCSADPTLSGIGPAYTMAVNRQPARRSASDRREYALMSMDTFTS
jgi:carboxypeptidase C (cathepsin A)